jgi:hypothetical protein
MSSLFRLTTMQRVTTAIKTIFLPSFLLRTRDQSNTSVSLTMTIISFTPISALKKRKHDAIENDEHIEAVPKLTCKLVHRPKYTNDRYRPAIDHRSSIGTRDLRAHDEEEFDPQLASTIEEQIAKRPRLTENPVQTSCESNLSTIVLRSSSLCSALSAGQREVPFSSLTTRSNIEHERNDITREPQAVTLNHRLIDNRRLMTSWPLFSDHAQVCHSPTNDSSDCLRQSIQWANVYRRGPSEQEETTHFLLGNGRRDDVITSNTAQQRATRYVSGECGLETDGHSMLVIYSDINREYQMPDRLFGTLPTTNVLHRTFTTACIAKVDSFKSSRPRREARRRNSIEHHR